MNDIERQKKIEADAIQDGVVRYFQNRAYQLATDTKPGRDLLGFLLKSLADAILHGQVALKQAQGRKLPKYAIALLSITAEKLALITLGELLNAINMSLFKDGLAPALAAVAKEIGKRCRMERIYDCLQNRQVDVAYELSSRNRSRHAKRRAEELARKVDDDEDWAKHFRAIHLGEKLIALALQFAEFDGQPMFESKSVAESSAKGVKTTQRIGLTTAAAAWVEAHQADLADLSTPVYQPMVVRPRPWTSLSGGGYFATPLNLLKRQPNRRAQQILEKANLETVYSAVDGLQNSAYRINPKIYPLIERAWEAGYPYFGLETHDFVKLPPPLPGDADPDEIRERKQKRAEAYKMNSRIKGLRSIMPLMLTRADRLLKESHFYFPHQLDHRGRAYPVPQLITPQADPVMRSLLEFAEGKPLGERGPHWLAVHIANCYGKDKISFDDRVAWVKQHEEEIIAFANDPFKPHRFWKDAKKAWMFLAGCLEWKGYKEEGPEFPSHLPISMDGTCNGYQHLSALGRDPVGGRATNLIPGLTPADIYQDVADQVIRRIQRDAEYAAGGEAQTRQGEALRGEARARQGEALRDDRDAARQLLGKIDRNAVKHATMTTPYGVTRGTIYKALMEEKFIKSCNEPKKCARYLARILEECIPEVAVEAGNIMKWLREVARILAKANRGMAWTTGTGFYVVHETREPKAIRLATADHTLLIYEEDETRKIDLRKLVDGIVAHLVHSLDAAHMMFTIHRLLAEGLHDFAMVHDSYGVHACDVDLLHRVLREEFVRIYSEPVLQNFLSELRKGNPDLDLPDPPQPGNLDIRQVLSSPYFFPDISKWLFEGRK